MEKIQVKWGLMQDETFETVSIITEHKREDGGITIDVDFQNKRRQIELTKEQLEKLQSGEKTTTFGSFLVVRNEPISLIEKEEEAIVKKSVFERLHKYKLTEESIEIDGCTLRRIEALRTFGNVAAGDKGGFVESTDNLSSRHDCWIYNEAKVYNDARVYGNAKIRDFAVINEYAEVYGNAEIQDSCLITDYAEVFGDAIIIEDAKIGGYSKVSDGTVVKVHVLEEDKERKFKDGENVIYLGHPSMILKYNEETKMYLIMVFESGENGEEDKDREENVEEWEITKDFTDTEEKLEIPKTPYEFGKEAFENKLSRDINMFSGKKQIEFDNGWLDASNIAKEIQKINETHE